jgi:hypothetical protein
VPSTRFIERNRQLMVEPSSERFGNASPGLLRGGDCVSRLPYLCLLFAIQIAAFITSANHKYVRNLKKYQVRSTAR